MAGIRHAYQSPTSNNASKEVSSTRWNEDHVIDDDSIPQSAIIGLAAALSGAGGGNWIKLSANASNSTTSLADVAGMSFTAAANTTYVVELIGAFQSAATTTGIALALNIPSGSVIGIVQHNTSATAAGAVEQIADDATTGASTGVRAATTNVPIIARWIVAVGATGGTVQLRMRSEVASSAVTLQANLTAMNYKAI